MSLFGGDDQLPDDPEKILSPEENAVLDKVAKKTIDLGMSVPAILFLESVKPLNYISSQVMVFFEPIVQSLFNFTDYNTMRTALEKRESIEILLLKIEEKDAVAQRKERAFKKWYKQEKKKWKWYQRWLGVFRPRLSPPEDVINPPEPKSVEDSVESNGKKKTDE